MTNGQTSSRERDVADNSGDSGDSVASALWILRLPKVARFLSLELFGKEYTKSTSKSITLFLLGFSTIDRVSYIFVDVEEISIRSSGSGTVSLCTVSNVFFSSREPDIVSFS